MCDAETADPKGEFYVGKHGKHRFGGAHSISDEFAFSGSYSDMMGGKDQFGMTVTLGPLAVGESFIVSVMRKKDANTAHLVASCDDTDFYNNDYKVYDTDNPDWEMLKMEFHVSKSMHGKSLKVYAFNPSMEAAYVDDLKIVRFESYYK